MLSTIGRTKSKWLSVQLISRALSASPSGVCLRTPLVINSGLQNGGPPCWADTRFDTQVRGDIQGEICLEFHRGINCEHETAQCHSFRTSEPACPGTVKNGRYKDFSAALQDAAWNFFVGAGDPIRRVWCHSRGGGKGGQKRLRPHCPEAEVRETEGLETPLMIYRAKCFERRYRKLAGQQKYRADNCPSLNLRHLSVIHHLTRPV